MSHAEEPEESLDTLVAGIKQSLSFFTPHNSSSSKSSFLIDPPPEPLLLLRKLPQSAIAIGSANTNGRAACEKTEDEKWIETKANENKANNFSLDIDIMAIDKIILFSSSLEIRKQKGVREYYEESTMPLFSIYPPNGNKVPQMGTLTNP